MEAYHYGKKTIWIDFVDDRVEAMNFEKEFLLQLGWENISDDQGPMTPFSQVYPSWRKYGTSSSNIISSPHPLFIGEQFGTMTFGAKDPVEIFPKIPWGSFYPILLHPGVQVNIYLAFCLI